MNKPYVRSLNTNQHQLLLAVYSLRFSTRSLLSEYLRVPNNTSFYSRLQILQKHGYITSHYDKTYKLAGREAEFYLLPKGLRALRDAKLLDVSDDMLRALYKDKTVGSDFLKQQTTLLRIRNKLACSYENLQIFTLRDIQALEYFPKPRPDLFMSMKNGDAITRFFVEYISAGAINSKLRKRLEYLTYYNEQDIWAETDTPFPVVLFITETGLIEAGLRRLIQRQLYNSDSEIIYYTTTQKAVLGMTDGSDTIWTDPSNPGDLLALPELE